MRILLLGAYGMLGHRLARHLGPGHEVTGAVRTMRKATLPLTRLLTNVRAEDPDSLVRAFRVSRPEWVLNCMGLVKQRPGASDEGASIVTNALLPHRLAELAAVVGARLLHFSTDCVFSGVRGQYKETDVPDPVDTYGRSKLLGEVVQDHVLTLRTSMIGPELASHHGLLDWFVSNQGGSVSGYAKARFSGLSTLELARLVERLLQGPAPAGVWHAAAQPISKLELLERLNEALGLKVNIEPDERVRIDRSLDASAFNESVGYEPPPWIVMVDELGKLWQEEPWMKVVHDPSV